MITNYLVDPSFYLFGIIIPGFLLRAVIKNVNEDIHILELFRVQRDGGTLVYILLESMAYGSLLLVVFYWLVRIMEMITLPGLVNNTLLMPAVLTFELYFALALFFLLVIQSFLIKDKHNTCSNALGALLSFALAISIGMLTSSMAYYELFVKDSPVSIEIKPNCSSNNHLAFLINRQDYPITYIGFAGSNTSWNGDPIVLQKGELTTINISFNGTQTKYLYFIFDIGSIAMQFDCNNSLATQIYAGG